MWQETVPILSLRSFSCQDQFPSGSDHRYIFLVVLSNEIDNDRLARCDKVVVGDDMSVTKHN